MTAPSGPTPAAGAVPPRYVVTHGGTPTPEQLAALAVALTPVAVAAAPTDRPRRGDGGWMRAALLEGVGLRPAVSATDVQRLP